MVEGEVSTEHQTVEARDDPADLIAVAGDKIVPVVPR
jgi:hypothetical protein